MFKISLIIDINQKNTKDDTLDIKDRTFIKKKTKYYLL